MSNDEKPRKTLTLKRKPLDPAAPATPPATPAATVTDQFRHLDLKAQTG